MVIKEMIARGHLSEVRLCSKANSYNFLCVLDGVQQVEGRGPKGHFELRYVKDGRTDLLNGPSGEMLHEFWNRIRLARTSQ